VDVLGFTSLVFIFALIAGFLGALTGLGGGVVIIPVLALVFHVDIRYAIGASLISVIATSSGAAAAYVKEGFTNIRIGMFLEIATTIGALVGAHLVAAVPTSVIGIIFGVVLVYSAVASARQRKGGAENTRSDRIADILRMNSDYPTPTGPKNYPVRRVPGGFGVMFIAGGLSGLLGIGSGAFKVLAMDQVMRVPFKVSTTTSNFMIGVTAAAGAGIYLHRGYIDPGLAMPVMLGVLAGSYVGSTVLTHARSKILRLVFAVVILLMAVEMIYNGVTGNL
jgi:uncharacterized membrane protein YfcA